MEALIEISHHHSMQSRLDLFFNEVQLIYSRPYQKVYLKVSSSAECYQALQACYPPGRIDHKEFFYVLYLTSSNEVLAFAKLSEGGLTGTMADVREIFQIALRLNSVAIIISHNHPSGSLHPSPQDKSLTRKIVNAGIVLDIKVLDHLIITRDQYFSFSDEGLM